MLSTGGRPESEDCGGAAPLTVLRAMRRGRILQAAERTFLRDGYRGTTMDRVAEEVGVTKQTLYNYFHDKEELFASLLEANHGEDEIAALERALYRLAEGHPSEALREATEALFRYASNPETAAVHRIMVEIAAELPEVMVRLRKRVFLDMVARVQGALECAMAAGAVCPVDSEAIAHILFGVAAAYRLFRPRAMDEASERMRPERMAAVLADLLGHGILTGSPPAAR